MPIRSERLVEHSDTANSMPPQKRTSYYLDPAIDVVIIDAIAIVSFRMKTILITVVPGTAPVVPVGPVSSTATATTLPPGPTPFPRFPPFHRDPRWEALVFPDFPLHRKGNRGLFFLVGVGRTMSRVATVTMSARTRVSRRFPSCGKGTGGESGVQRRVENSSQVLYLNRVSMNVRDAVHHHQSYTCLC